jgi:hypothetical protein
MIGVLAVQANVAERVQLLLVYSKHGFFLAASVVETRESSGTGAIFPCDYV